MVHAVELVLNISIFQEPFLKMLLNCLLLTGRSISVGLSIKIIYILTLRSNVTLSHVLSSLSYLFWNDIVQDNSCLFYRNGLQFMIALHLTIQICFKTFKILFKTFQCSVGQQCCTFYMSNLADSNSDSCLYCYSCL